MRNSQNTTCSNSKHQLACLYTKHKSQKRKIWQDGRLVLSGGKAILHDADPPPGSGDPSLGECEITAGQLQAILQQYNVQNNSGMNITSTSAALLETERYLIEIEGPWKNVSSSTPSTLHVSKRRPNANGMASTSMKKLLKSKFQKPKSYIPPPPGTQTSRMQQVLGKRRRPLQPGELVARHYGGNGTHGGGSRGGFDDPRNSYNNDQRDSFQPHGRSRIGERNETEPQLLRPELERYGRRPERQQQHQQQPQQLLSNEQPMNITQATVRNLQEPKSLAPSGGARACLGVDPAVLGPQSRKAQHQRHRNSIQQRKHRTISFAQNEFDSARYYGVDGEEEEEDEEESIASPQAPIARALPPSSHALPLVDPQKCEKRQNDQNDYINPCNDTRNSTTSEALNEDTIQTMDNVRRNEKQLNPRHGNQNNCPSSLSSLEPLSRHDNIKNSSRIGNSNNNDRHSVAKVPIKHQSKKDKVESYPADRDCHLKKLCDDSESERDGTDLSDEDVEAPLPFQLKPMGFTGGDKNACAGTRTSGNRLLALFGAGAGRQSIRNDGDAKNLNTGTISEKIENGNGNERIANDKENFMLEGASAGVPHKRRIVGNFDKKVSERNDGIEIDKNKSNEKQEGSCNTISGFYLAPASSSSEESSEDEGSDEE